METKRFDYWNEVKQEIEKQMTPKEKAKELVDTYSYAIALTTDGGKAAATIAVDEIITQYNFMTPNADAKSYWIEVKKEIEKL